MSGAVKLGGGFNATFISCEFYGYDVAIDAESQTTVNLNKVIAMDTDVVVRGKDVNIRANNVIHHEPLGGGTSYLTAAIRRKNYGNV
ncbi:MAG: hypothetical protein E6Q70_10045 [Pseudomonas monteilii]|nr:MAG: hypothetical protein E6Q70_10045 [Pseudomonas monteilii]